METNEQLLQRYKTISEKLAIAIKKRDKMKIGRDRQSRFCGSLNFTKLQIESELRARGLMS